MSFHLYLILMKDVTAPPHKHFEIVQVLSLIYDRQLESDYLICH